MKKLNINHIIKVKLTDHGKDIFYHQHDELNKYWGREVIKPYYPPVDEEGFTEFQAHEFMNIYGKYLVNGFDLVIENNNIYIYEKDLEDCDETV